MPRATIPVRASVRALLGATLGVPLAVVGTAGADVIHVPADHTTIQAAVAAAVDGDEVVVAPGAYTGPIQMAGKSIVVRSTDPLDPAVVDATILTVQTSQPWIVSLDLGELAGFTISGSGVGSLNYGAVWITGDATVRQCVIRSVNGGNVAGGMFIQDASPLVLECTFVENTGYWAGGIGTDGGSPTISACSFIGNVGFTAGGVATGSPGGTLTIEACLFVQNQGSDPGTTIHLGSLAIITDTICCANLPLWGEPVTGPWTDGGGNDFSETCPGDCNANLVPDEEDLANGTSADCNANGIPDECDIASGRSPDCNWNGVPDPCDIADGTSPDCDGDGIPDQCGPDCNGNGVPDACDIADGVSLDCDADGLPDECTPFDCNDNGVPDACDIADGTSDDCDLDGLPDECQSDCNDNGVPDACDIANGVSPDCDADGIPDECQPDCNGNGVVDACDIDGGTSPDCNGNGVPDECDGPDCDGSGVLDACDIADGTSADCDGNGVPDTCDLDGGAADCDGNGIPDSCDIAAGLLDDCNENGIADLCQDEPDENADGVPDDCQPARNITTNAWFATIQEAIDDAADGDEIVVMPGVYPALPFPEWTAEITGKSITLRSLDPSNPSIVAATVVGRIACGGAATSNTVIDGFTLVMGDHVIAELALAVSGSDATIRRCVAIDAGTSGAAAITAVNNGGSPTLDRCRFIGSQLAFGAIWSNDANPLIVNSVICGNTPVQVSGPWTDGGGNVIGMECPPCVFESPPCCPADVDGDGEVDVDDLVAVVLAWGTADQAADVDGDGFVGVDDLVVVITSWGPCPWTATTSIDPRGEPAISPETQPGPPKAEPTPSEASVPSRCGPRSG
ncbi:MAG: hypothetical protein ACYTJ0_09330, partial [Planctomycetota bacterium]